MSPRFGPKPLRMLILAVGIVASVGPVARTMARGWRWKCQTPDCDFSVFEGLGHIEKYYGIGQVTVDGKTFDCFRCPKCKKFTVSYVDFRTGEMW